VSGNRLCALREIPDGGSAGFAVTVDGQPVELMAIRRGGDVFVYVNSCPHWGSPLDLDPGCFLNREGTRIHCSTHGAQFRIEDGFCIKGPCLGASLQPVHCIVSDGEVLIGAWRRPSDADRLW
jgi:naringenin degradation protein FdeD